MLCNNERWWVVELDVTDSISGPYIASILEYLHKIINFDHTVIGNVDGYYDMTQIAIDRNYTCYTYDQLIPLVSNVKQFFWCDIFCYKNTCGVSDNNLWNMEYPEIISNTLVSLRVVDFSYIEIFINSESVLQQIIKKYDIKCCQQISLSDYIFAE